MASFFSGLLNLVRGKPQQSKATEQRLGRFVTADQSAANRPATPATSNNRLDRVIAGDRDASRLNKARAERDARLSRSEQLNSRLDKIKTERERIEAQRHERGQHDPEYRFLRMGEIANTQSSNVSGFQFDERDSKLTVFFNDGSVYAYSGVPPWKALRMYRAPSAGGAVWDFLRIRHTKLGHQHGYWMISGPTKGAGKSIAEGFGTRKWERTAKTAKKHYRKGQQQSMGPGGYMAKKSKRKKRGK